MAKRPANRSTYRDARGNGGPRVCKHLHESGSLGDPALERRGLVISLNTKNGRPERSRHFWDRVVFIDEREDTINDVFFYVTWRG